MKRDFLPEELSDAKKLAEVLSCILEDKRSLVTMVTMAFINGMEAQEALAAKNSPVN